MNSQREQINPIRFSFNDNRLSISKEVLRTIGNPQYIQVFVSKDRKTFFIKGCDTKEPQSFAVPNRVYADSEYKYRLRKAAFSEAICSAIGFDSQGKYRLYGAPVSDHVIGFSFSEAVRLGSDTEES